MNRILQPTCLALFLGMLPAVVFAGAPINELTDAEQRSGWQLLFDGKSTDGWRNYKKDAISDGWKVVDGAIVRSGRGAGDIITDKKYGEFELSLEYKISKGGNSGVMFHVVEGDGPPWHTGPEIQVQDNVDGHDPQKAGWLYQLYQPTPPRWAIDKSVVDTTRPAGDWNQLYVRIAKDQCEVCMNGVRYYRFKTRRQGVESQVAAKSKFAKFEQFGKAGEGHICLQDHGNEVAYRNIKVREIGRGWIGSATDRRQAEHERRAGVSEFEVGQWEAVDEDGKARPLRLMELTYAKGRQQSIVCRIAVWRDLDVREQIRT